MFNRTFSLSLHHRQTTPSSHRPLAADRDLWEVILTSPLHSKGQDITSTWGRHLNQLSCHLAMPTSDNYPRSTTRAPSASALFRFSNHDQHGFDTISVVFSTALLISKSVIAVLFLDCFATKIPQHKASGAWRNHFGKMLFTGPVSMMLRWFW
jgi:hypothetical protein